MKKLFAILCLLILFSPCYAGGVGYINYEKVASEYQFAKASMREIETKGREIENYLRQKKSSLISLKHLCRNKSFKKQYKLN